MPSSHATLSPSGSERWISCPASVQLEARMARDMESTSTYALEGTKAHALGELEAARHFGLIDVATYRARYQTWIEMAPYLEEEDELDMRRHIEGYVEFLAERAALYPDSQVLLEQRVDTGIESCWGTSDAIIVSPIHVEATDLKYGQGIPVNAEGNTQLRLYGVGALDMFDGLLGDIETVRVTVYQPRLHSTSTEELSADELRAWRDSLVPIAAEALHSDKPRFGPSEKACRWCAAAGECRARIQAATDEDFGTDPDLITPEEMASLLDRIPAIKAWCANVEDAALRKAYSESVELPGWKVVLSGGKRSIPSDSAAISRLKSLGFKDDEIATLKLNGLGVLEKLTKARLKKTLDETLGVLIHKGEGKPSLVHEDDPRPSVSPNGEAAKEFDDIDDSHGRGDE